MSDEHDHDWHGDNQLAISPVKPKLQRPPKYRVLMLNDDYTPMDFVIEVLEGLFSMGRENATRTMLQVHTEGMAPCGVFTFEIAEAKVEQANSYGAHKDRTNRDITKFMDILKSRNIYTIARVVTFKDELQASNNPDYAIKKADGTIWRNHDNMAWVDPFDKRAHKYIISIAEEAASVGFDEINFDYIRFPAKSGLKFSKKNTPQNRIEAIGEFLDLAQNRLRKYGVFISADTYGNICWSKDDNNIGQTVSSLAQHADYLAPMLYPSGFASGSFYVEAPSEHPYIVIYRSIKHIKDVIEPIRIRPWLQYFKDYAHKKRHYKKFEVNEQIRATQDANTSGWMMWSPSSKYHLNYLTPSKK